MVSVALASLLDLGAPALEPEYLYTLSVDGSHGGLHLHGPTPDSSDGAGPNAMAVNSKGEIVIADWGSRGFTIRTYTREGRPSWSIPPPSDLGFSQYSALARCEDGSVYAYELTSSYTCARYDANGNFQWREGLGGPVVGSQPDVVPQARLDGSLWTRFFDVRDGSAVVEADGTVKPVPDVDVGSPVPDGDVLVEQPAQPDRYVRRSSGGAESEVRLRSTADMLAPGRGFPSLDAGGRMTRWTWHPSPYPRSLASGNRITTELVLTRYDRDGTPLAQVRLAGAPPMCALGSFALAPNGDAYCLIYDWDRVHLVRVPLSRTTGTYVALNLAPRLTIEGRTYVPLASATWGMPVRWDAKAKVVSVSGKSLSGRSKEAKVIEGRVWVTRLGAQLLGLRLDWHPKGFYAYVSRRKAV